MSDRDALIEARRRRLEELQRRVRTAQDKANATAEVGQRVSETLRAIESAPPQRPDRIRGGSQRSSPGPQPPLQPNQQPPQPGITGQINEDQPIADKATRLAVYDQRVSTPLFGEAQAISEAGTRSRIESGVLRPGAQPGPVPGRRIWLEIVRDALYRRARRDYNLPESAPLEGEWDSLKQSLRKKAQMVTNTTLVRDAWDQNTANHLFEIQYAAAKRQFDEARASGANPGPGPNPNPQPPPGPAASSTNPGSAATSSSDPGDLENDPAVWEARVALRDALLPNDSPRRILAVRAHKLLQLSQNLPEDERLAEVVRLASEACLKLARQIVIYLRQQGHQQVEDDETSDDYLCIGALAIRIFLTHEESEAKQAIDEAVANHELDPAFGIITS